jgi:DNA-binding SARP family transcriptional activator/CheY-like chemotaxis protein
VQLRLLRGQGFTVDGRSVTIAGRMERLLLVVLGLEAGRDVDQDRLINALWGDEPPRTAVKSLQSKVWRLRSDLEASGVDASIERSTGGYRLDIAPECVDVMIVADFVEEARIDLDAGRHRDALASFDEALSFWQGRSLGEFADEPSLLGEAARLDELRVAIAEERIEALLAVGQVNAAIEALELLCVEHPFREALVALRMLALYRSGRQAESLAVFQDLRTRLRDELGLEPSAPLYGLERAILKQDPELDLPTTERRGEVHSPSNALRVMLVDDHPIWRQAVRTVLEGNGDVVVVAEADDGESAVALAAEHAPDLILMDLHLPGKGGIEATRVIVEHDPQARVLVLSASEDENDVLKALRAGAFGYVLKSGTGQEVVDAVRRVVRGEAVFSSGLSSLVLGELRRTATG